MVAVLIMLVGASCKKPAAQLLPFSPLTPRKVQFSLYTNKDFSHDNQRVVFRLSIQKANNQLLWDSVLAPMLVRDIPDAEHKLVVEKLVPGNDYSLLKVGFYYSIENVGNSWHLDSFAAGVPFKAVDFNFQ